VRKYESVEAERVQSISYPHIRSLLGLLSVIPIEETGEARVGTNCLNCNDSLCIQVKNKYQLEDIRIIFFVEFYFNSISI